MARKACFIVLAAVLAATVSGCGSSVQSASTSSPSKLPPDTLAVAPMTTIAASDVTTNEPSPTLTNEETIGPDVEAEPEETDPPGVWIKSIDFGINANKAGENLTYVLDPHIAYTYEPGEQATVKSNYIEPIKIGQWDYYLDYDKPIQYTSTDEGGWYDIEFPVMRKNSQGKSECLNIYGFNMVLINGYLYIYTKRDMGTDFATCDTWRVKPDGSEIEYVGQTPNFYKTTTGKYIYFTDGTDYSMLIYRSENDLIDVESLYIVIPDLEKIEKSVISDIEEIENGIDFYSQFIKIKNTDADWIYFSFTVLDDNYHKRYYGEYKIGLDGGAVSKTDTGEYYPAVEDVEEGD